MPTVVRAATIPLRPTIWSDSVTLGQVDPALGIQSLALSLTGTVASTVNVTNYDLAPAVFGSATSGLVFLSRPDGSAWLGAAPAAFVYGVLPSASGGSAVPVQLSSQGSATSSVGYVPAQTGSADAALLIGTGQVTLPVTASARIHATGPGSMTARFTSLASADVSFTAATGTAGDGGSYGSGSVNIVFLQYGFFLTDSPTGGTRSQTLTAADASIGAVSALSFDAFDPSLGVLDGVTLSIAADASGSVRVENLDPVAGSATLGHTATVTLTGADGGALASSTASFSSVRQLSAFDGTDDLAGASAAAISESAPAGSIALTTATITGAGLGAFRSGPVALGVARSGSTTLDAPGNLDIATTLQAGAEVTVAYHYVAPVLHYTDTATGQSGTMASDIYSGPVAGLQRQYIWSSPDGVAISSAAPDVFLHGGAGTDALAVSGGSNVLDGGGGSNFLVGATGGDGGHDTFFLDARDPAVTWSTLVNFHQGDMATIFGFRAGTSTLPWTASDGAAGYLGLTVHSETSGAGTGVNASLTFAGISQATADAHWSVTSGTLQPGTAGATDYLLIQWNR